MELNPLTHRAIWTLGLAGGAAALGLGIWAVTRKSAAGSSLLSLVQAIEVVDSATLCAGPNSAVTAFQQAWNAAGNTQVQVDGKYGPQTAAAAQTIDPTNAPSACASFTNS